MADTLKDVLLKNLEELEQASSRSDDKGFAGTLRKAMDRGGAPR